MLTFKRGKNRYISDYKTIDIYKFFCKKYDIKITQRLFTSICKDLNSEKIFRMIVDGDEIFLSHRLGSIRVRKRKKKLKLTKDGELDKKTMPVKWLETKKMWEKKYPDLSSEEIAKIPIEEKGLIYNWNEHSNMYTFKFYWDRHTINLKNKFLFVFKATRTMKTFLAKNIKENNNLQYKYFG